MCVFSLGITFDLIFQVFGPDGLQRVDIPTWGISDDDPKDMEDDFSAQTIFGNTGAPEAWSCCHLYSEMLERISGGKVDQIVEAEAWDVRCSHSKELEAFRREEKSSRDCCKCCQSSGEQFVSVMWGHLFKNGESYIFASPSIKGPSLYILVCHYLEGTVKS